jgi:hypothetical protein
MNLKRTAAALLGATVLSAGIAGNAFARKTLAPRGVVSPAISPSLPGGAGGSPGGGSGGGGAGAGVAPFDSGASGSGTQGGSGGSID